MLHHPPNACSMNYDFTSLRDRRGTDSLKWLKYRDRDVLPMWVADMDFHAAPEIIGAVEKRARDGVYGYSRPTDGLIESVLVYFEQHLKWSIQPEWIVWLPGLVPGLNLACRAVGTRGDAVLVPTPVYPPFLSAPQLAERSQHNVPLRRGEARWEFDWDAMERAITPHTRLLLLCHPHNPVARVWSRAELTQLAEFCTRHDLVICSDEVHCDLLFDDVVFTPTASLSPEIAARTITLNSPSKTYNIAGLAFSYAVIPDARLRAAFRQAGNGMMAELNPFGLVACEAAYRHGEPWRQAMLQQLRTNRDLVLAAVNDGKLPGLTTTPIEATYLAWLNVEALGLDDPVAFFEAGGVGLSDGRPFGDARHVRFNFACPESNVREGLARMSRALAAR
jgi:cystathionine beta-lyase